MHFLLLFSWRLRCWLRLFLTIDKDAMGLLPVPAPRPELRVHGVEGLLEPSLFWWNASTFQGLGVVLMLVLRAKHKRGIPALTFHSIFRFLRRRTQVHGHAPALLDVPRNVSPGGSWLRTLFREVLQLCLSSSLVLVPLAFLRRKVAVPLIIAGPKR